jgi:hypothetical protein
MLHALATDLVHVPVDSTTRELHIRALELRRDLGLWNESSPGPQVRQSALRELEELGVHAASAREERPSGRDLLAASSRPSTTAPRHHATGDEVSEPQRLGDVAVEGGGGDEGPGGL